MHAKILIFQFWVLERSLDTFYVLYLSYVLFLAVNPVPKLLVVSANQISIEEVDSVGNKTVVLEPIVSPMVATYLAQENRMFWVDKNNMLKEQSKQGQKKVTLTLFI